MLHGARIAAVVLLVPLAAAVIGGCGDDSKREDRLIAERGIADPDSLPGDLISAEELDEFEPGSVQRAFLDYWSSLQYQDWDGAAGAFDPRLRKRVGNQRLIAAWFSRSLLFKQATPAVVGTRKEAGRRAVRYAFENAQGDILTQTSLWRRGGGRWRMLYDSFLDDLLGQTAAAAEQRRIDPTEAELSARALEAGDRARDLQRRFLDDALQEGG